MARLEQLQVTLKGRTHAIELPHGAETTAEEVQRLIESHLQIPRDAQRLFYSKRRLELQDSTQTIAELCGCDDATTELRLFLLAGATSTKIEEEKQTQRLVEEEQRIRANRHVVSLAKRNEAIEARESAANEYRFYGIEELKHFSDSAKAREILERLANDRGILAVMKKHKWSVGVLAEMHPDGKVGVDPVCVLGLNQNKGQKILLRLRTDDLLGFRKFLSHNSFVFVFSIKKVLFHELTHNVHSEHDSKFYQLMRQVEKECNELDWSQKEGDTVGGGVAMIADDLNGRDTAGATGVRLGGGAGTSRLLQMNPAPCDEVHQHDDVEMEEPREDEREEKREELQTEAPDEIMQASAQLPDDEVLPSIPSESTKEHETQAIERIATAPTSSVVLHDFSAEFEDFPMSDRERRIHNSLRQLRQLHQADVEAVSKALSLLYKIVSNIIQNPSDEKFRTLRRGNRLFENRVARYPECLEFLSAIGFEGDADKYLLVRQDPGLLWIGRSTLEVLLSSQ